MDEPSRWLTEYLLLTGFCAFLFFFGLADFGLLGPDEPRYAQVAREMLLRHDWITPTLSGKPWLEKPVLYYWQAILAYRAFGVSDWAARLPAAVDATVMVLASYLFLGRFCPGFQLDGALITASAAGMVGFARAAGTDMPLAAMFTIALLAWYAWHQSRRVGYLGLFYLSLGLATLAKGPVAVVLAAMIIGSFAIAKREKQLISQTFWIPGILLFLATTLPWYIAVEIRNPEFFRVFILEHNLARFTTAAFHHHQPFWFYFPVVLLGLLPWTVVAIIAVAEAVRMGWHERRVLLPSEGALQLFLLAWLIVPMVFFSASHSKLPGYILPALPAATMILADYLRRHTGRNGSAGWLLALLHSTLAVLPLLAAMMLPQILWHRPQWGRASWLAGVLCLLLAFAAAATLHKPNGLRMLRLVTLVPVILTVAAILRLAAPAIDARFSARPMAAEIQLLEAKPLAVAVFGLSPQIEHGLEFYLDQRIDRYEIGEVPPQEHLLVVPAGAKAAFQKKVAGRRFAYLGTSRLPESKEYYWISKQETAMSDESAHE
jgi:4-amino-4-deoxy-L-arabinose transferase-like glycosyltransferase